MQVRLVGNDPGNMSGGASGDWLKVRGYYCKGKSFVGWVILSDCDFVAVNP